MPRLADADPCTAALRQTAAEPEVREQLQSRRRRVRSPATVRKLQPIRPLQMIALPYSAAAVVAMLPIACARRSLHGVDAQTEPAQPGNLDDRGRRPRCGRVRDDRLARHQSRHERPRVDRVSRCSRRSSGSTIRRIPRRETSPPASDAHRTALCEPERRLPQPISRSARLTPRAAPASTW